MCSDDQIELIGLTSDAIMNFKLPSLSHGNFQTLSNIKTDEFTEHFNLTHRVTTRNTLLSVYALILALLCGLKTEEKKPVKFFKSSVALF